VREVGVREEADRQEVKAAWQPQVIFSVMVGGVGALLLVNGLVSHRADWLEGAAIFGMLWAGIIAWFRGFTLKLDGDILLYKAPLSPSIRVKVTSIQSIRCRRIEVTRRLHSAGLQTVVIEVLESRKLSVVVNARVFPEDQLKTLLEKVASRGVTIDY
jgi:hypothetical protein